MVVFYPEFETPKDPLPDVTIMLDMSNSMIGSTATIAKQISMLFVSQLAEHFKDGTIFNVVRFGSGSESNFDWLELF